MLSRFTAIFIFCLVFIQCERPGSPDFTLSRTVEFPILKERNIYFLGGGDALIDTTRENFQELFIVDDEHFVTLSREEPFNFGNLNDAIPQLEFEPTEFHARVGPIVIGDFATGDLGSAGFQNLTGEDSRLIGEGDSIPGGATPVPVNIQFDTDYFVSATISDGSLHIVLENQLGFDIDQLNLDLYSGSNYVESISFSDLLHGSTQHQSLDIPSGTVLENINIDVSVSWGKQELQDAPGELIVRNLAGENLVASEVVGIIGSQEFGFSGTANLSTDEFRFETSEHYIEIESGQIVIRDIINELDVDLEVLEITFPDIRYPPFHENDALVIRLMDADRIRRNSSRQDDLIVDLSGLRIFAEGNRLDFNVYVLTEDLREGLSPKPRAINENDEVKAVIEISDFQFGGAFGIVANREFFLSENDPEGVFGQRELFNEHEAQSIRLRGFQDFSGKLDGLEFTDISFSLNYQTNIGIPVTITGAFLGITNDGQKIYLSGRQGAPTYVQDINRASGLLADGSQLGPDQLIQFSNNPVPGVSHSGSITLDRDNSNIVDFVHKLPSEIRFIGKSDLNRNEVEGTLEMPIQFDPSISMDIPISIQTLEQAVYKDTLNQSLSGLPDESDNVVIEEGVVNIVYRNYFPVDVSMHLEFLDENDSLITKVPLEGGQDIAMQAAETDASGFSVEEGYPGNMMVSLNNEQLSSLYRTEKIILSLVFRTFDKQEVKLRTTDRVNVSLSTKFILESSVN